MAETPSNHSSQVITEHTAKYHSPNGGLRAIRRNNGWDDDAHKTPQIRDDFLPKARVKRRRQEPTRTYDSEFGVS